MSLLEEASFALEEGSISGVSIFLFITWPKFSAPHRNSSGQHTRCDQMLLLDNNCNVRRSPVKRILHLH